MAERLDCDQVRDLLPELAAGGLPGDERATVLAHLPGCAGCSAELAGLVATADRLLALAPAQDPPDGFIDVVLRRLPGGTPPARPRTRHRTRRRLLAAGLAGLVTAASTGAVWLATADDRRLADEHRRTLAAASGRFFAIGPLTTSTGESVRAGRVVAYQGDPSWIFVIVRQGTQSGSYRVSLLTHGGRSVPVGEVEVRRGEGSWGTTITIPVDEIAQVRLAGGAAGMADLTAVPRRI